MKQLRIEFDPVEHAYTWAGTRYMSVTQVLSKYHQKFDTEQEAVNMAYRHGKTPEYWYKKWKEITDDSLEIGTALHAEKEELTLSQAFEVVEGTPMRVQNEHMFQDMDYWYWPDGIYPELTLWNHKYRLAGRADKVVFGRARELGMRMASVMDYKTNKRIRKTGWWDEKKGDWRRMNYPVQHLVDSEYWHYALQLSMYQFMLEEMGFYPGHRVLLHYAPLPYGLGFPGERNSKPDVYRLPYLRKEVIDILDHYATQI